MTGNPPPPPDPYKLGFEIVNKDETAPRLEGTHPAPKIEPFFVILTTDAGCTTADDGPPGIHSPTGNKGPSGPPAVMHKKSGYERANPNQPWYAKLQKKGKRR